jgi:hypothetical protein
MTTTYQDVLAVPDDLDVRRAWSAEGTTREQRLMRYQLARHDHPDAWSLVDAEAEAELAYALADETPFADIPGARVKEYRDGVPYRVQLAYRGGVRAGADTFVSPHWNTLKELELGLSLDADAWRSPRLAQFRSMRLVGADLPFLVGGLEASGHLESGLLAKLDVFGFEGEAVWPALLRLPRLVELHTAHTQPVTPPPGAFSRLQTLGGDMRSNAALWTNELSVTRLVWGDAQWRFEAQREPGAKVHHLTLTPHGGAASALFNGRITWKDKANRVGGHDDDRGVVHFGILDGLPANIAIIEVPQRLEVEWGARLLGTTDQKKLGEHVGAINEKRATKLALHIARLPPRAGKVMSKKGAK